MGGPIINIQEAVDLYHRINGENLPGMDIVLKQMPFQEATLIFARVWPGYPPLTFRVEASHLNHIYVLHCHVNDEDLGSFIGEMNKNYRSDEPIGTIVGGQRYVQRLKDSGMKIEDVSSRIQSQVSEISILAASALRLMLCKNITYEDYDPLQHLPRQQRRERERKGRPLLKYQILHINPLAAKTVIRNPKAEPTGRSVAVHAVRGHFMTATVEHPLFGKPWGVGTFWIGPYVCGNPEFGLNWNDYHIEIEKTEVARHA